MWAVAIFNWLAVIGMVVQAYRLRKERERKYSDTICVIADVHIGCGLIFTMGRLISSFWF